MADLLHLQIADIQFAISSPCPIVVQEPAAAYQPFLPKALWHVGDTSIHVHLVRGQMPTTQSLTQIFDAGQSWAMYAQGKERYLSLNAPASLNAPLWLAHFALDLQQVTVYCSEQLISDSDGAIALSNPVRYPLDQLLLMYVLAREGGALIHAAGASIDGKGFIFAGPSAAGKTTLSRLLAGHKQVDPLSDDRMVVRKIDGGFRAFGTPWPGEARIARNGSTPLSGIFFIHHGARNWLGEITEKEALEKLLPVTSIPWYDRDLVPRMLLFCEDLVSHVPVFDLHFKPDSDVVNLLCRLASV